jgi:DNA-binding transcriptional regulator YdaS (Cro superfamily)
MHLNEYLAENNMTMTAFAARVGVSRPAVSYWLCGKTRPAAPVAARIRQATGGKVTADDLQAAWEAAQ